MVQDFCLCVQKIHGINVAAYSKSGRKQSQAANRINNNT